MSSRKYVPNRLRGVLGADDGSESPSPGSRSSSLRLKGRKSRPWRVDAASWKQQLQERKAVYDHFALPERVDEEQKETSKELHPPQVKRAMSLPSNIMGLAESDQNQNVETIVTPKRGEQVEMVLKPKSTTTTTTPLSALLSSTANHQASDDSDSDADSCETNGDFLNRKQSRAIKSDSISSSHSSQQRKSSVLPHRKKLIAVDVASPGKSRRSKTRKDTDLTDSKAERIKYDINLSDLVASSSRDSDIGIIDGVPIRKSRVFTPNSKVRLLRHGDSDDTEESTGFIVNEDGTTSYVDAAVNKSTVMEATEDFIGPSKGNNGSVTKNYLSLRKNKSNSRLVAAAEEKSMTRTRPQVMTAMYENEIYVYEKEEVSASRSPVIVRNDAESFIVQNSPSRRGGRRRPRPAPRMPELSAALSVISPNGTVTGRSMDDNCQGVGRSPGSGIDDYNETKSISTNSSKTQDGFCSDSGSDDEWSTRPVPSDEDECLEKRRWPLRKDTDSTTSCDADIISMMNDVVVVSCSVGHHESGQNLCDTQHYDTEDIRGLDESDNARGKVRLREQMPSSFSSLEDKDGTNRTGSLIEINDTPKHEMNDSEELTAATQTALTPDPLQRARKTLLLSNFNRSMRSLQDSPLHSRRRYDQTMDDLSVENSPSRTIFVPLRSREPRIGNPIQDTNRRDISLNVLNDHGVYVSQYNENGIYVPPNTHSMQSNTNTARFDSTKEVYNELGAFVPSPVASQQGNSVNNDEIREMEKNNKLNANENSDVSITTHPSKTVHLDIVDTKLQDSVANDEDNVEDSNVSEGVPPNDREGTVSRTTIGGNDNARIDDSETADKQLEVCDVSKDEGEIESASKNKSDDGIDVALSVASTLAEDERLTVSSEPDNELVSTNQDDMKSSLGVLSTELNGVIEDGSEKGNAKEGDDGSAVDKMVVIKQQVISDLKARTSMIYTGNHICIETVGTSNNSESLLRGRQNRASQRNSMRETEETVQLNAELNDKVSSMNTDHHHIIESPGKVKSGQGKWKERMALKKAAKKRNSHVFRNHVNTCDAEKTNSEVGATTDLPHQEPPGEHPTRCEDEQKDPLEPVDNSTPEAPIVEKSAENATEQAPDKFDSNDDDDDTGHFKAPGKKQDQSILMKSDESGTAPAENSNKETMEQVCSNEKPEVTSDAEHLNAAEIVGKINNDEDATNVQKCSKESLISKKDFKSESDPQENCPSKNDVSKEPTTAQANALDEQKDTANNVPGEEGKIEGLKTDRKIGDCYSEALTTDDQEQREINELHTIPDNDNNQTVIQGMPQSKGKKWKDRLKKMKNSKKSSKPPAATRDTENTQQQLIAPQSNNLGSSSSHSENSDRPTYKRGISDLTAPPEEEPHSVSPSSPSAKNDTDNMQINHLGSSSISVGASSTHSENSSHRSTLNDDTLGLVAQVDEKSCLVPSSVAEHADNSSKNGGKKSNKWKNRLAKKKITKQDSMRTLQIDVKAKAGVDASGVIEPPGGSKPTDSFVSKAVNPTSEPSTYSKNQHTNEKTNISSKVEKSEALGVELNGDRLDVPATQAETISSQAECNEQNQSVRRDLHESFTVFDAFLQGGYAGDSSKDQLMNDETNIPGVNKSEVSDPKYYSETPDNVPFQSGAILGMTEPKEQNPNIQQDLRKSFTVFDAFLKGGHVGAMPIDEESIYTELTVGEETMLQNSMHDHQNVFQEEEQSYMDFTMEESLQSSYVDQTIMSSIGPKDQKISPFMSNLLSSRMFQDDGVNQIPLESMQDQRKLSQFHQVEEPERPDVGTKQFPTITVGVYDDDMTQITMGSFEGDDTDADVDVQIDLNKDDLEDEFFDAETTPISRAPSSKSFGKKSGMSKSSRRSESAASTGSQVSCSESSKQRIAEILRKEIWSPDTDVVEKALEDLEMEAKKGYNFRSHIVRCGGVMTIMKAMETNPRRESILVHCCSTLEKLALEPQTQVAVCEMEGISLIVRSMQDHVNNPELQESACAALATICRQQEANTEQDPMKDAEGAVPTLLSCMTRFPRNAIIQAKAFAAISNLCTGSHSQERLTELSKAGGIITLTMALQTPWESKNEKQEAISNLPIILRGLTDLHENDLPISTEDDTSKLDGTSRTSNETESMSTMKDDNEKPKQIGSTIRTSRNLTRSADGDTESLGSCFIEEIPELPMMESSSSNHIEEIPNLGEFPTMMSNLEWQNFDNENPDSSGKKSTHGMSPDRTDKSSTGSDEQCIIQ